MKPLTRAEQETIIRKYADEDEWDVSTTDPVIMRQLRKLPKSLRKNWRDDKQWGVWVSLPVGHVQILIKRRKGRTPSPETIAKMQDGLRRWKEEQGG